MFHNYGTIFSHQSALKDPIALMRSTGFFLSLNMAVVYGSSICSSKYGSSICTWGMGLFLRMEKAIYLSPKLLLSPSYPPSSHTLLEKINDYVSSWIFSGSLQLTIVYYQKSQPASLRKEYM